jgi:hypothetical protein
MNGYICFYNRQRIEVHAQTSYKAQCEAARLLKVPVKKQHLISVTLCERVDGTQVVHSTSGI